MPALTAVLHIRKGVVPVWLVPRFARLHRIRSWFKRYIIALMAFEKAKVLKAAEKFLSQGKIDAAIKEYRQIVENDHDDFTTLNMLGDLCVRAGKNDEAVSCFMRIAEHYRDREFTLKAIAMYKKVDRLKPRDLDVAANLGALYAAQGLIVDARAQYLIVADSHTRNGQTKQALEVLRKIADLDPRNVEIRLKLANGYLKEGIQSEAAAAFKEAAGRLFETGDFERSLEAGARALELTPYDQSVLSAMVSAHTALGTADEAAEILERTVADRPDVPEFISMLAGAYISAEDPQGAERATGMMMERDGSNYPRFIPVAQLYLKANQVDDAVRVLQGIIEQMLAGREENDLLELVNEVLARNPEHVEGLRLLVRIHWWQRDMDKLRASLERLAEAAEAAGSIDDERYALTQLVRLAPDETRYLSRLEKLGGGMQEVEAPPTEPEPAEPALSDVPTFETFGVVQEPSAAAENPFEFETNSVAEPAFSDPSASFADLNDGLADVGSYTAATNGGGEAEHASGHVEFDFAEAGAAPEAVATEGDDSRRDAMMRQELESVDFYLSQGYFDIAEDTLQMLSGQYGAHAEIDNRRARLAEALKQSSETPAAFNFAGEPQAAAVEEEISTFDFGVEAGDNAKPPAGASIDSGLAEVFEEFKIAAEGDESSAEDYETHYNMGTAYKEMDLLDEAIQEFQNAANLTKPSDGTARYLQCCNMLGHCFAEKNMPRAAVLWFKKGLESPGHSEEEYLALRYELGSAYEQLGDIGRAIDTFTEVYGVNVSYREVGEKLKALEQQKSAGKKKRKR
jgi:tetratricopeptide (TPR) repeat protein